MASLKAKEILTLSSVTESLEVLNDDLECSGTDGLPLFFDEPRGVFPAEKNPVPIPLGGSPGLSAIPCHSLGNL